VRKAHARNPLPKPQVRLTGWPLRTADPDMPWKCPACVTALSHSPIDATPRPGVIYRCSVCRLEFVLDTVTKKFTLAPLPSTEPPIRPRAVTPE
jgi:hypothetical protein